MCAALKKQRPGDCKRETRERKNPRKRCFALAQVFTAVTFSAHNLHSSWTNSIQEDTIAAPDTHVQSDDLLNPHSERC